MTSTPEAAVPNATAGTDVLVERLADEPSVVVITLNRPERRNAYTAGLCAALVAALEAYAADPELRVAVLRGAGGAFCSGGDVRSADEIEQGDSSPFGHGAVMRTTGQAVVRTLLGLTKPVIASIDGPAVAGGLTFALACDLRIASDRARLGDTSGRFGLLPDEGGTWLFPRAMGLEPALRMSMLGEVYPAEEALRLGLVGQVVPTAELDEATAALARRLTAAAPLAVTTVRRLMRSAVEQDLGPALEALQLAVDVVNRSADVAEGVAAFVERRPPRFRGA
jgi:2-(1,2-epoxy-1,2-dihydrophenyl)acetyl-CoA isomerase